LFEHLPNGADVLAPREDAVVYFFLLANPEIMAVTLTGEIQPAQHQHRVGLDVDEVGLVNPFAPPAR